MPAESIIRPHDPHLDRPATDRPATDRFGSGRSAADGSVPDLAARVDRRDSGAIAAAIGSIAGLAVLKLTMLAALFAGVEPHPPGELAPLFGASLALSALAVALLRARSGWFLAPAVPVAFESLVSYGPQKFFIGQSVAIYPAVAVGSTLVVVLALATWRLLGRPTGGRAESARAVASPLAAS